jgi:DegV family protein with EDD domain
MWVQFPLGPNGKENEAFLRFCLRQTETRLMRSGVKKIIKKTKHGSARIVQVVNPLARPLLYPPKFGWKAAKFGAKMAVNGVRVAARPIHKLLVPEKAVMLLGINDFQKMMLAASKKIVLHQEEINRINVWPVADKDTGYNLAATLLGIEGVIGQKDYRSFSELSRDIREAAMTNARGNAGMILTGYLIRFLDQVKSSKQVDGLKLGLAMKKGTKGAWHSIMNPTEGTILDVMTAAGEKVWELTKTKKEKNIIRVLEEAHKQSKMALEETKRRLDILRRNDVVDAGGLGFVKVLEAWLESLKGAALLPENNERLFVPAPKTESKLKYRYDAVFQIKKISPNRLEKLKRELGFLGNSIDILEAAKKIKIHVHVNSPERLKSKLAGFKILEWKVEDMAGQVAKTTKKKSLGLVIGESADLPSGFLEKNEIIEIPFQARFPDGQIIKKEKLFPEIRKALETGRPLPITSAPSFSDFVCGYEKALQKFQEVLVLTISSKLSGAYSSARIARSMLDEKQRLTVLDCFTAEAGEALVTEKIQELIDQGKEKKEIMEFLNGFCPKIKVIGGMADFNYLSRSGRLKLPKIAAKIISLLSKIGIWFLFSIEQGKIKLFKAKSGNNLAEVLAKEMDRERKDGGLRAAIAYGENLSAARQLKRELEKRRKIKISFFSRVSPVVGVYTGPDVLIVGFYPVDEQPRT